MSAPSRAENKLEFDTPQCLHSLMGNDPKNLAYLESEVGVEVVVNAGGVGVAAGVRSGLVGAEHALKGVEGIAFQQFSKSDIVRHPVVGRIVEAYERHRE